MFAQSLALSDRGLHYGDGLFETMAVQHGRVRLLPRHMQRLAWGAERLAISPPEPAELEAQLNATASALGEGVLKLILTRGGGGRGYAPPATQSPTLILLRYPQALPPLDASPAIELRLCELPLGRQPRLAGIKHLNRLEYVLARAEWQDEGIAEGLLLDSEGELIEATASNVFLCKDGVLLTPILDQCGVAGVMRAQVMACAARMGVELQETRLRLDDVLAADEIFLTNSLHGIRAVQALRGLRVWPPGVLTQAVQHAVHDVLRGAA